MIDPGESSGCDSECQQDEILAEYQWLIFLAEQDVMSDLEAFALLSDYAASLTGDCVKCYINNMGAVLTGHDGSDGRTAANDEVLNLIGWPGVEYDEHYHRNNQLQQDGFADVFQDPMGGGGDQPHHFWFYVQVGYESGYVSAILGNAAHETVAAKNRSGMSYNDYALGSEGAVLGNLLSLGLIKPSEVGDWLRVALAPGSSEAMYYMYP